MEESYIDETVPQVIKPEEALKNQKGVEQVITLMSGFGFAKFIALI